MNETPIFSNLLSACLNLYHFVIMSCFSFGNFAFQTSIIFFRFAFSNPQLIFGNFAFPCTKNWLKTRDFQGMKSKYFRGKNWLTTSLSPLCWDSPARALDIRPKLLTPLHYLLHQLISRYTFSRIFTTYLSLF